MWSVQCKASTFSSCPLTTLRLLLQHHVLRFQWGPGRNAAYLLHMRTASGKQISKAIQFEPSTSEYTANMLWCWPAECKCGVECARQMWMECGSCKFVWDVDLQMWMWLYALLFSHMIREGKHSCFLTFMSANYAEICPPTTRKSISYKTKTKTTTSSLCSAGRRSIVILHAATAYCDNDWWSPGRVVANTIWLYMRTRPREVWSMKCMRYGNVVMTDLG